MNFGADGAASFTKNIPLKSAIYDAATDTVYLVPMNKVKPNAKWRYPFQVVSPNPSVTPGVSNLTDTSGNPIAANDPSYSVADRWALRRHSPGSQGQSCGPVLPFRHPLPSGAQGQARTHWLDAPVLNFRSRDSPEIGQVPGAQGRIVGECECSDFEVHRTDTQGRAAEARYSTAAAASKSRSGMRR